jgi:hypothetical protein
MWIEKTWEWLVAEGIYRDIVSAVVVTIIAPLLAFKPLRKHFKTQKKIANELDTSTPGGITDLLHAVQNTQNAAASGMASAPGDNSGT